MCKNRGGSNPPQRTSFKVAFVYRDMKTFEIKYRGPGNSWDVTVKRSTLIGKRNQLADVSHRTAWTFIKTHTKKYGYFAKSLFRKKQYFCLALREGDLADYLGD